MRWTDCLRACSSICPRCGEMAVVSSCFPFRYTSERALTKRALLSSSPVFSRPRKNLPLQQIQTIRCRVRDVGKESRYLDPLRPPRAAIRQRVKIRAAGLAGS